MIWASGGNGDTISLPKITSLWNKDEEICTRKILKIIINPIRSYSRYLVGQNGRVGAISGLVRVQWKHFLEMRDLPFSVPHKQIYVLIVSLCYPTLLYTAGIIFPAYSMWKLVPGLNANQVSSYMSIWIKVCWLLFQDHGNRCICVRALRQTCVDDLCKSVKLLFIVQNVKLKQFVQKVNANYGFTWKFKYSSMVWSQQRVLARKVRHLL